MLLLDNDFSATNRRASIGFELRNAVLDFHSNIYQGLKDSEDERVLGRLGLQISKSGTLSTLVKSIYKPL